MLNTNFLKVIKTSELELDLPKMYTENDCVYVVAERNEGEMTSLGAVYSYPNVGAYVDELEKYETEDTEELSPEGRAISERLDSHFGYIDTLDECYFGSGCDLGVLEIEEDEVENIIKIDDRQIAILKITRINLSVTRDYFGEVDSDIDYDYKCIDFETAHSELVSGFGELEDIFLEEFEEAEAFLAPYVKKKPTKQVAEDSCTFPRTLNLDADKMEAEYKRCKDWESVYAMMNMD